MNRLLLETMVNNKSILSYSLLRLCSQLLVIAAFAQAPQAVAAEQENSLTGRLLVALPNMKDPRFSESVIYIVKHDREGTFGLVINRVLTSAPIEEVLAGFGVDEKGGKGEIAIHYGGPVSPRQGFVLHSDDIVRENSTRVNNGMAITSDPTIIRDIALGKGPRQFLLIVGYAGWAPGQLEGELQAKAWFSIPADKEIIFSKQTEKKWQRAMDKRQVPL
jgi:putative transcriptional regulator